MINFFKKRQKFLVLSAGKAGSTWLASSLNLHPDITCSGGVDHPIISLGYYYNEKYIDNLISNITNEDIKLGAWHMDNLYEITPLNYREKYGHLNYFAGNILSYHNNSLKITPRKFGVEIINHIFDELVSIDKNQSVIHGNVHGFTTYIYKACHKSEELKKCKVANLIRNPITRFESAVNNAKYAYRFNYFDYRNYLDNYIKINMDEIEAIKAKYNIAEFSLDQKITYLTLDKGNLLKSWEEDITNLDIEQILFEKIISDPSYFEKYFRFLTGIKPGKFYIDHVFSQAHLNSGRSPVYVKEKTPSEIFECWEGWLKDRFHINNELYNKCGIYDLPGI